MSDISKVAAKVDHVRRGVLTIFFMPNAYINQGTAGVALAGLLGAVRSQGRPLKDFVKQKIVVVGAGRYVRNLMIAFALK